MAAIVRPVDLRLRMGLHNALEARRSAHAHCDVFQRLSPARRLVVGGRGVDQREKRFTGFSRRGLGVNDSAYRYE